MKLILLSMAITLGVIACKKSEPEVKKCYKCVYIYKYYGNAVTQLQSSITDTTQGYDEWCVTKSQLNDSINKYGAYSKEIITPCQNSSNDTCYWEKYISCTEL